VQNRFYKREGIKEDLYSLNDFLIHDKNDTAIVRVFGSLRQIFAKCQITQATKVIIIA
jgi:hypothetical protein